MAYSTSTLAQGCFGKVYKQKYNDTWAAIKKVPQQLISRKDLERECDVYNKADHPNIVKLLGNINLMDGKWIIPLEFIFGEDLETTIFKASKSKIQLTPSIKGTIIIGMCEGMLHLHSKDIVHQDLKPENIMVS
nr:spindle assembly checkpoint kinase-like [Labrus bergylta]